MIVFDILFLIGTAGSFGFSLYDALCGRYDRAAFLMSSACLSCLFFRSRKC